MDELKVYTAEELTAELLRLDTLLTRKRHAPAQLKTRRDAVVAEIARRPI